MKILLKVLSWAFLVLGILSLSVPISLLVSALSGEGNTFSLAAILPTAALSLGMGWFSLSFLKRKGRKTANRIATLSGFLVWLSTKSAALEFSESAQESFGKWAIIAVIFLPVCLGILTTKIMKFFIRKAYEADDTERYRTPT